VKVRRVLVASLAALVLPPAAAAGDAELLRAQARYLPPAQLRYGNDPDGLQARYDAGRDLVEAVRAAGTPSTRCRRLRDQLRALGTAQARTSEAYDRPIAVAPPRLPAVTASCRAAGGNAAIPVATFRLRLPAGAQRAVPPRSTDSELATRLARIGATAPGWAGLWVHDLRTGGTAGWNSDARFPAASTVKLGVIAAALDRSGNRPELSPRWYDLLQIGAWSSNLASNRLSARLGYPAVAEGLRRLGMRSSTYPGPYRAATAHVADTPRPPPHAHTRVTTARDLGRALYRIHAGALGNRGALRATALTQHQSRLGLSLLLEPERAGDNVGLLRPWLGRTVVAEKNGWLSDTRTTAAIVYRPAGPVIVVVELYRLGVTAAEGRRLGRRVLQAAGLAR
jgi:Beta-lactamase enzyme family